MLKNYVDGKPDTAENAAGQGCGTAVSVRAGHGGGPAAFRWKE
jgi:hypothetical protein